MDVIGVGEFEVWLSVMWRFWEVAIAWSQICGALGGCGKGEDIEDVGGDGL